MGDQNVWFFKPREGVNVTVRVWPLVPPLSFTWEIMVDQPLRSCGYERMRGVADSLEDANAQWRDKLEEYDRVAPYVNARREGITDEWWQEQVRKGNVR